jgi:putative membrane protein
MKTKSILAISIVGALALSASAAFAQGKPDKDSQKFIKTAIEGNIAEVNVGKLAQEKGKSQAVKDFGKMLETDHGKANDNAKTAASQIGVEPPSGSSVMEKATYLKLKVLSGNTFDQSFASSMVSDHKSDIKAYQKEASKSDPAGEYAKKTLPDLKKHLRAANDLQAQLKQTTGSK